MYRITLASNCVNAECAEAAARHITEEFTLRPWHKNVRCEWDGSRLLLHAENDYDANGFALVDEFSDAITACIGGPLDGDIEVLSVAKV